MSQPFWIMAFGAGRYAIYDEEGKSISGGVFASEKSATKAAEYLGYTRLLGVLDSKDFGW